MTFVRLTGCTDPQLKKLVRGLPWALDSWCHLVVGPWAVAWGGLWAAITSFKNVSSRCVFSHRRSAWSRQGLWRVLSIAGSDTIYGADSSKGEGHGDKCRGKGSLKIKYSRATRRTWRTSTALPGSSFFEPWTLSEVTDLFLPTRQENVLVKWWNLGLKQTWT